MTPAEKRAAVTQIISNINESDVAAYAINDYWTFDGYLELRSANDAGEALRKTVFPAIELRIESASKHRLNIHVILSDKVTVQQLNDFKSQLRLRLIDRPLSDEALIEYARRLDGAKAKNHGAPDGYLNDTAALAHLGAQTAEITKASFEAALKTIPEDYRLVMVPYLCLKLATQAFTQPLIFDQPEDDLDNEFIIEELVEIFRGIKQFRQVILVTHNANLVVNADAEQVVVAENANGVMKYTSGSLEAEITNRAVRRILEGGDEAFLKRELRYNLK